MKKIALAAAVSVAASSAFAGNINAPVVEPVVHPEVVVQDTSSSSAGVVGPLLLVVLVGAALAAN